MILSNTSTDSIIKDVIIIDIRKTGKTDAIIINL